MFLILGTKKSSWCVMRSNNARVRFSCALFSKGLLPAEKGWSKPFFSTGTAGLGGECERGGAAGVPGPQKGRPSPRRRRRKVRLAPFPPEGENYARSLAPPLPTKSPILRGPHSHRSIALSRLRYSSKAFTIVSSIFCAGVPGLKNLSIRSLGILNCST